MFEKILCLCYVGKDYFAFIHVKRGKISRMFCLCYVGKDYFAFIQRKKGKNINLVPMKYLQTLYSDNHASLHIL